MKDYFSIENFGVQVPNALNTESKENERALDQLKNLTTNLNFRMAMRRLQCLEKQDSEIIQNINETSTVYVNRGYTRKLTNCELQQKYDRIWYLPIFTVSYPKKPEKIRIVFDGAAIFKNISLNSMVLKGREQLVSLVSLDFGRKG